MHDHPVLVTGAGGFLGRHTVPALTAKGLQVRAMLRPDAPRPPWCEGVECCRADLLDPGSLAQACAGVGAVVHLAALLNIPLETAAASERLRRINRDGTADLLAACRSAGVKEFLFMSSVAAQGDPAPGTVADDTAPARPTREYGRSKLEAEGLVAGARREWGLRTLILRPVVVYGEGDKGNVVKMLNAIGRRRFALVGGGRARKSLIYAGNLAAMTAHLLPLQDAWEGESYIAMDPEPCALAHLATAMAGALKVSPPRINLPALPLRLAGGALEALCRPFGLRPLFSGHTVRKLTEDLLYDGSRLYRETGFTPPYTLEAALENTVANRS